MKLVDLQKSGFLVEPRYYFFGWSTEPRILGRASAVKALVRAQGYLPKGMRFKVWDMHRTRPVQLKMLASFKRELEQKHPKLKPAQIQALVDKFGAKPLPDRLVVRPDCHRNGGAVDLTIIDRHGCELYMGTCHDSLTEQAASLYYETKPKLSPLEEMARNNRRILRKAMQKAGWDMLQAEWWHWSTIQ